MVDILSILNAALFDALPFAILCLGLMLSVKYLHMPDLTACGSFVLGAAVASIAIVKHGWSPLSATLLAALAGVAAGALTGFFYTVLGIEKLLSAILASSALFALNLWLLTPTIPYGDSTLISALELRDRAIFWRGEAWHPWVIGGFAITVCALKLVLDTFFASEMGLALRALEDEVAGPQALQRQGLSPRLFKFITLCAGNAIIAFGGAMISYKEGAANAQRGFDVLITGLVALLLGWELMSGLQWLLFRFGRRTPIRTTTGAIAGAVAFFFLMTVAQRLGISSEFTEIVLVIAVALASARPGSQLRSRFFQKSLSGAVPNSPILSVQQLTYRYPLTDRDAVKDLSFHVAQGDIVELAGGNGTGKTTALKLVAGFFDSEHGQILYRGQDVTGNREARVKTIVYVDQLADRGVVGVLTTAENLALAAIDGKPSLWRRAMRRDRRSELQTMMREVGLREDLMDQSSLLLSGGQRQVLNLLTLLARKKIPELVLLDEPTNHLDAQNANRCGKIILRLRELGAAVVYVSHMPVPGIVPNRTLQLAEPLGLGNEIQPETTGGAHGEPDRTKA